jgi:hypothetical protein
MQSTHPDKYPGASKELLDSKTEAAAKYVAAYSIIYSYHKEKGTLGT